MRLNILLIGLLLVPCAFALDNQSMLVLFGDNQSYYLAYGDEQAGQIWFHEEAVIPGSQGGGGSGPTLLSPPVVLNKTNTEQLQSVAPWMPASLKELSPAQWNSIWLLLFLLTVCIAGYNMYEKKKFKKESELYLGIDEDEEEKKW
jgi:cbb3-type cytochrome oxidase subunit 3